MSPIIRRFIPAAIVGITAIIAGLFLYQKVHKVPDFAVLYCDTATFSRMVDMVPPPAGAGSDSTRVVSNSHADYGSLFFKYYLAPKNLSLHGWSFKPGRGSGMPEFDPYPDLRLTIGRAVPDVKFYTGDYAGDFILNKSKMVFIQNAYREKAMKYVLFYPQRIVGENGIQWRIVLAKLPPLINVQYAMSDSTGVGDEPSEEDIYLNPIPPKGVSLGSNL